MDEYLNDIEKYLSKQLNPKEMEAFENKLKTDKDLAAELELYKDMMGGLRLHQNKQLKKRLDQIHEQEIEQSSSAVIRPMRWKYAAAIAAACLLIILSVFLLKNENSVSPESLFASHYAPYEPDWTRRGGSDAAKLNQAKQLYETQQYETLVRLLENDTLETAFNGVTFTMIKGISSLETGDYEAARAYFKTASGNSLLKAEADWYTALSFLKEKDIESSKVILERFANDPSSDYQEEAVRILEQL